MLGHELLARVKEGQAGFEPGQLVAGIVRRPDPVPCACCAQGEWDMCRNGQLHRARHQGARRLRRRARDARGRLRGADPGRAGHAGRPRRTVQHPRQGLGADRAHQPARLLGARARARDRRRADRPARGADGRAARPRGARARPRHRGPQAGGRACARRPLSRRRHHGRGEGGRAGRRRGMHRRGRARGGCDAAHGAWRDRVPDRGGIVADAQRRRRRAQQRAGARERRRVRLGEREPAPLRAGGQCAARGRPGLASPADHDRPCRSSAGRRRSRGGGDDIKVVVDFAQG